MSTMADDILYDNYMTECDRSDSLLRSWLKAVALAKTSDVHTPGGEQEKEE